MINQNSQPVETTRGHEAHGLLPDIFPESWACDWGEDQYGLWMAFRCRGIRQCLRWIAPGEFMMGSPQDEPERYENETPHKVILTQGFWLADTACTQALWQVVMGDNPSNFKGAERPVESVSWDNVQQFIQRINQQLDDEFFRLPTEAEWEYACRAGTQTPFWFGEQITPEQVNYDGNYPYVDGVKGQCREKTVNVKALPCNGWGLYQMHGNVYEWCQDWYGGYPAGTATDPTGPDEGERRVLRGGSWISRGRSARSALRYHCAPDSRDVYRGFRFARGQVKLVQAPEASTGSAGQRSRSGVGQGLDGRV